MIKGWTKFKHESRSTNADAALKPNPSFKIYPILKYYCKFDIHIELKIDFTQQYDQTNNFLIATDLNMGCSQMTSYFIEKYDMRII